VNANGQPQSGDEGGVSLCAQAVAHVRRLYRGAREEAEGAGEGPRRDRHLQRHRGWWAATRGGVPPPQQPRAFISQFPKILMKTRRTWHG